MHIVRGALVMLLRLEPDIDVVTEVASGLEILPGRDRPVFRPGRRAAGTGRPAPSPR